MWGVELHSALQLRALPELWSNRQFEKQAAAGVRGGQATPSTSKGIVNVAESVSAPPATREIKNFLKHCCVSFPLAVV